MNIKLQTARLYLREFTLADAELLFQMHQDPAITRYTGDPLPWDSVAAAKHVLKEAILPQYEKGIGRWAVHLKQTDEFIGWCGLKDVGHEIDLGYRYIQTYWGNGYATEAAKAVLEYGKALRLPNIVGRASVDNKASLRVLEKIGLQQEGYYTEPDTGSLSIRFVAL